MNQKDKIKVLLLEPNKLARVSEIDATLEGMQKIVGGSIETAYFFNEPVCLVCNEEGKVSGLDLNRAIYNDENKMIDIIAGTAFICDCSGENFGSLSDEQQKKYEQQLKYPERFYKINDEIKAVPFKPVDRNYER